MGSEVTLGTLGDVAKVLSGFAFKSSDMGESGHPVIKIKNINPPDVDVSDVQRIPASVIEANPRIEKFRLDRGDILIAMTGATVGKIGRMPAIEEPHYLNQRVGKVFITDKSAANEDYVYYVLSQDCHVNQIFNLADGSAQANISGKQIESVEIPLHPLSEQKTIAHILGSLDAKIELNRKMNQTLETMAQALFQGWFVDFDPVIDKALANGKEIPEELSHRVEIRKRAREEFPELFNKYSDLFPDSFHFTEELGWIPEGWDATSLGDHVEIRRGGSPRPINDYLTPDGLPWVKISDATSSSSRFLFKTKQFIKASGLKKTVKLNKGSLILSNSATPGIPVFLELDACIHDGWLYFPKISHFTTEYLYQLFKCIRRDLVAQGNGSVFTNLKTDILKSWQMVYPSSESLNSYNEFMGIIGSKLRVINSETLMLSSLRDTLLPKLISGEIDVSEFETTVLENL